MASHTIPDYNKCITSWNILFIHRQQIVTIWFSCQAIYKRFKKIKILSFFLRIESIDLLNCLTKFKLKRQQILQYWQSVLQGYGKPDSIPGRVVLKWYSNLTDKMKCSFFQAAVVSILLYGCTKRMGKKPDGNCARMLRAILNKSWRQHSTK